MKINFKSLLLCIVITFFIGSFFALFIGSNSYVDLNKAIDVPGYILFMKVMDIIKKVL